ncbi:MAPEG family protein [Piscinibacter terrae]|uniref:MAPEG family protein n=1 Tax=Piscinibacter terrae TaxID=2496871 RepID=A0A3N7HLX3_9BURK|nr:MAPEG family protein [Albitalea terrae]RQP23130.1 hypothetical protein DZC73_18605 [Albitalea terrae]
MRAHSNFAEYVPLALLLLAFMETGGAGPVFLHAMGASLLVGRVVHAYGVSQLKERFAFRVVGMTLTFVPLLACASRLLIQRLPLAFL